MDPVLVCGCSSTTSEAELRALLDAGAGEVFVGYVPDRWAGRLGLEVSPNRRYEPDRQIGGPDRLRRVGELVRARGAQLSVTLNEHLYAPAARALVPELVETALEAGATHFIVADLQLLAELAAWPGRRFGLIASCEAGLYNVPCARAHVERGAERVIFSREMRLPEMRAIAAALPGVALEAFVAREACVFSSAACFTTHGYGLRTHFCCAHTRRTLVGKGGPRDLSLAPPAWSQAPAFLEAVSALNRCGLCALAPLLALGVTHLKIPGRSDSALRALRLVRRALDARDRSPAACRALVGSDEFCRTGSYCYYRLEEGTAAAPAPGGLTPGTDRAAPQPVSPAPTPQAPLAPALSAYLAAGSWDRRTLARLARRGLGALVDGAPFFGDWEAQAAARGLAALAALGLDRSSRPAGVHLGIEQCALRLPSPQRLRAAAGAARDAGFAVSLVAPVAYQAVFAPLCAAVEEVLRDGAAGLTLVANDLGLLAHAARTWPVRLATGRLFNRMKRDVYAPDPALESNPPGLRPVQAEAWGHPHLAEPFFRDLLRAHGVAQVGMDVLPTPLSAPLAAGFAHAAYLPWAYLTGGRACALAAEVDGAPASFPTVRCTKACTRSCLVPEYPWKHRPVAQRGAGVFLDVSADAPAFLRSGRFDTLVFEARVPC